MNGLKCYNKYYSVDGLTNHLVREMSTLDSFNFCVIPPDADVLGHCTLASTDSEFSLTSADYSAVDNQSLPLVSQILKRRFLLKLVEAMPEFVFLSGEAVRVSEAQTAAIVGPSFSGKSTLAKTLIEGGASPWSSDVVVVSKEGYTLPFPHPERPHGGLPSVVLALSSYTPDAPWQFQQISPGQATLQLTSNLLLARDEMGEVMSRLGKLCKNTLFRYHGTHGSNAEVVNQIQKDLGTHAH